MPYGLATEMSKPIKISEEAHSKYASLKKETGKSIKRLVEDGSDALELLPRLIAAVESEKTREIHKALAEAKTIV